MNEFLRRARPAQARIFPAIRPPASKKAGASDRKLAPIRGPRESALCFRGERRSSGMSALRLQKKPEQAIGSLLRRGGGGWIRTIEGKASRFTVCPLWPLGYSSVFSWAEEGGAGGRIRTPDLLITNQLLYQLSYTSTAASAFTTMLIITAGGGFVNSFSKKKQRKITGGWSGHGRRNFSGPAGEAVLPVPGRTVPRRPLFRAGRPGGVRGLPGPLCPAVFRPPAAPGGQNQEIYLIGKEEP